MPAPTAVDAPPMSGSTMVMDVDPSFPTGAVPPLNDCDSDAGDEFAGGPMDALRRSLHDVSAARLKMYHHQCDQRLAKTLRLQRDRADDGDQWASASPRGPRSLGHRSAARRRERQWKLVRESSDVRVYRQRHVSGPTVSVMAAGTVHGALVDVMNGLYADSTREARVVHALLSPRFADARVLKVDRRASDARPLEFAGITWTAVKMPGLGLCKPRDFLCFKKMDLFKHDDGADGGFLVLQSIDPVDDVARTLGGAGGGGGGVGLSPRASLALAPPPSAASARHVRGFMSLAVVFRRVDEDRVALFAHGEFALHGRVPQLLRDLGIAELLVSLAHTVRSGEAKNLTTLLQHTPLSLPPMLGAVKPRCGVCARALFFWDAPRSCRSCWTLTCRTCRVVKPIFCAHATHASSNKKVGGALSKPHAPCTETFCLPCVCAATPSGAVVNALLLSRLEKKRKRQPSAPFRPTLATDSTVTDVGANSLPLLGGSASGQHGLALLLQHEVSSISVLSSRESEKHQQHRLSLNPRPAKRQVVTRGANDADEDKEDATPALPQQQSSRTLMTYPSAASGLSISSGGAASLVSFSSTDLLAPPSTTHSRDARSRPPPSTGGSFRQPNGSNTAAGLPRRRSQHQRAMLASGLHREAGASAHRLPAPAPPVRDDEYYHKLLQAYLRGVHSQSTRSLALSMSSINSGDASAPPTAERPHVEPRPALRDSLALSLDGDALAREVRPGGAWLGL